MEMADIDTTLLTDKKELKVDLQHLNDSVEIKQEPLYDDYEALPSTSTNKLDVKIEFKTECDTNSETYESNIIDFNSIKSEQQEKDNGNSIENILQVDKDLSNAEDIDMKFEASEEILQDSKGSTSRYKRKTDRGNVNLADVVHAIRAIKCRNETMRAAAQIYNLPRTSLSRYLKKVSAKYENISTVTDEELQKTIKQLGTYTACAAKQVFSTEEEEALIIYAKQYSDHYYGLSILEWRELAYKFAKKIQTHYPQNWDVIGMSGRDWYYGFMRRHQELKHREKLSSRENVGRIKKKIKQVKNYKERRKSGINKHKTTLIKCDLCKFVTKYPRALNAHVSREHNATGFQCEICDYKTTCKMTFKKHINGVHKNVNQLCDICGFEAENREKLKGHKRKHSENKFYCGMCDFTTKYAISIKSHQLSTHIEANEEVDITCTLCDFVTKIPNFLKAHQIAIHQEPYVTVDKLTNIVMKCPICEKSMTSQANLKDHILELHIEHKGLLTCYLCDQKLSCRTDLFKHVKAEHVKDESKKCSICCFQTNSKINLQRHIRRMHENDNNLPILKCVNCDFLTKYKYNLTAHIKAEHKNTEGLECNICSFKAMTPVVLNKHKKYQHQEVHLLECCSCAFKTKYSNALKVHERRYHYKIKESPDLTCSSCNFTTVSKHVFNLHTLNKDVEEIDFKQLQCAQCDFKIQYLECMKEHILTHQNEENVDKIKCTQCSKVVSKKNLKIHVERMHFKYKNTLTCFNCNYVSKSKINLQDHIKRLHSH